jgi:hypothetical protein
MGLGEGRALMLGASARQKAMILAWWNWAILSGERMNLPRCKPQGLKPSSLGLSGGTTGSRALPDPSLKRLW